MDNLDEILIEMLTRAYSGIIYNEERILKDMLGHEQLSTTEIYTHLENKQLRDAAKRNPLSKQSGVKQT